MAKDKRSFFEKLTGVVRITEGSIEAELRLPNSLGDVLVLERFASACFGKR